MKFECVQKLKLKRIDKKKKKEERSDRMKKKKEKPNQQSVIFFEAIFRRSLIVSFSTFIVFNVSLSPINRFSTYFEACFTTVFGKTPCVNCCVFVFCMKGRLVKRESWIFFFAFNLSPLIYLI